MTVYHCINVRRKEKVRPKTQQNNFYINLKLELFYHSKLWVQTIDLQLSKEIWHRDTQ